MSKLENELNRAEINLERVTKDLNLFSEQERKLKKIQTEAGEIIKSIKGLEITKTSHEESDKGNYRGGRHYDPGKSGAAYYFVKSITEEDIKPSMNFKPFLMYLCPDCNEKAPVIMSYKQTRDSPDGDTWTKKAFITCCNKVKELKTISDKYRFL